MKIAEIVLAAEAIREAVYNDYMRKENRLNLNG
jgi:hypothetical protein